MLVVFCFFVLFFCWGLAHITSIFIVLSFLQNLLMLLVSVLTFFHTIFLNLHISNLPSFSNPTSIVYLSTAFQSSYLSL